MYVCVRVVVHTHYPGPCRGADQAKFQIMKATRWPNNLEGESRPRVKVAAGSVLLVGRSLAPRVLFELLRVWSSSHSVVLGDSACLFVCAWDAEVVGSWAHGHQLSFTFVEENVKKGSNLTLEVLARTLEDVVASGRPLAANLWLQFDGASGENKNHWVLRWASLLVDRGVFRSVVFATLQVGHTHEDID